MTYPHADVARALSDRFVPVRVEIREQPRLAQQFDPFWTPALRFADWRGTVFHRAEGYYPPTLFLALLDIGEAQVRLRRMQAHVAADLLRRALERDPQGALAPEVAYWLAVARYRAAKNDGAVLHAEWDRLKERYPASLWARKIP
ncbi:MAG TPA: hypothetical protein VFW96_29805 [Thermomicrobiales bacterium]|nr:hypothetical protein [Thermomicrobiales bacterium]